MAFKKALIERALGAELSHHPGYKPGASKPVPAKNQRNGVSAKTVLTEDEVGAWQARPLEPMYPVVFFDALRVKIREDGVVRNKAAHLALAVLPDSSR